MSNVIPLSGGNSADLRSTNELSERQRRPLTNALALVSPDGQVALEASRRLTEDAKLPDDAKKLKPEDRAKLAAQVKFSAEDLEHLDAANDLAIVAFTKHWTLAGKEITLDNVLDLPGPDYDALRNAVAPLAAELFVSFAPNKDANSPTAPSSESATRSEGSPLIVSQTSGEPTSSSRPA